jgi:large subunit ribosomal protein L5|tara:strand:+ start:29 stop:586 length:558 start_codon:yes stop_codon:yes gene_type:complete
MTPRLKTTFEKEILPKLMIKLKCSNKHQVPRITKIVLNIGLGEDATDAKKIKASQDDLSSIAGQKAIVTKFKKSIANFKTRKGFAAGVKVTLRSAKMYEFIDRLVNVALPRIKDFRGLSPNGIDKFGNYSFGIKEHLIFPEINYDKVDKIRGMDITLVTTSSTKEGTTELLKEFNFPINKTSTKN